jgi:hypothetical protein
MKLLKLDGSLGARTALAQELGYSGALDGSAAIGAKASGCAANVADGSKAEKLRMRKCAAGRRAAALRLLAYPGIIWGTLVWVCPTNATDYKHSDRKGSTSGV